MEWICVLKPNPTNQLSMYEDQKSSGHDNSRKNQPAGHPHLMSGNAILSWNLNQDLSCGRIHPDSSLWNTRPWLAALASWALNQVRHVLNSKGSLIHIHSFIHSSIFSLSLLTPLSCWEAQTKKPWALISVVAHTSSMVVEHTTLLKSCS